MAKERKMYAVKEEDGLVWQTELNLTEIEAICHEGAGSEMCNDRITIYFVNGCELIVDKIIIK